MKLHSSLCTGFDEMDSFGKREMTFLKAMITSNEDTFRPPYGRTMETLKRKFVLYGSGNREDFLQYDPSGYRRYPIITIKKKLELEQLKEELGQMWAEAWKLYTTSSIDVSQVAGAGEAAEEHVVASSLEERMLIAMDRMKDKGKPFMVTELLTAMGMEDKGLNSGVTRELAGYLRKLGYTKKQARTDSGPRYVWTKQQ